MSHHFGRAASVTVALGLVFTLPTATPAAGGDAAPPLTAVGIAASTPPRSAAASLAETGEAKGCGKTLYPKRGGGRWTCAFADNFNGTSLDRAKWRVMVSADAGYTAGIGCYVDEPSTVAVNNGSLALSVVKAPLPFLCSVFQRLPFGTQYKAGSVTTAYEYATTYGRYEIRAKFPTTKTVGLQSAVWLYPLRHWYGPHPQSGEIDIAELFTAYPDRLIPTVHYTRVGEGTTDSNTSCFVSKLGRYHKLLLIWTPRALRISFDGRLCLELRPLRSDLTAPRPAPFDKPFGVVLTQALGIGTNNFKPGTTPLPATMRVDYVRAWR